MKPHLYLWLGALALFAAFGIACARSVMTGEPDATPIDAGVDAAASFEAGIAIEPPSTPTPPPSDKLALYVHDALQAWRPSKDDVFYAAVASDIAVVSLSEAPLWKSDDSRGRTAILLATLAFFEGGLQRWVDRGDCNNPAWTKTEAGRRTMAYGGDCDGGLSRYTGFHGAAASLFQIHDEGRGFILTDDAEAWHWPAAGERSQAVDETTILASRQTAVRVALHLVRKSINRSGGLSGYTGGEPPYTKAKTRLDFAASWSARHPYKS